MDYIIVSKTNKPSPCKDCEDRILHCHSKCEKYAEYRERRIKQNELKMMKEKLKE